ncbi:MAG: DNA polymerase Y family protein [Bacteroidetes bacterium]|nr:DNA polymerase Y family protein [Bacteroidota bacterium]
MQRRFVSIWFRHLTTDWLALRRPELKALPFVFAAPEHGRMLITAANALAGAQGISPGMALADARALVPSLEMADHIPGKDAKLLKALGEWCIRYTPLLAVDMPDGLILDISGCAHLWGGESAYLGNIIKVLRSKGYDARGAIADTVGAAWAVARFGKDKPIIAPGEQAGALLSLPPSALRLEGEILDRLRKLGFHHIQSFMGIGRSVLRRRFGTKLLLRLDQALGTEDEPLDLLQPIEPYHERLPCLEPIRTAEGIGIAIKKLLENLCRRLEGEGMGLRTAVLKCYRVDGKMLQVGIGTNKASNFVNHLFRLFELKIASIEPDLGIELFTLDATKVEEADHEQEMLWSPEGGGLEDAGLTELLDRLANKIGAANIRRYLPQEHYWPERSIKPALSLQDKRATEWRTDRPRPSLLLPRPERIDVMVKTPDYPPNFFIYNGQKHTVFKSDGPERIEREWWLDNGKPRDYYQVEDEQGRRYWLFRAGYYSDEQSPEWFIHGFFA